MTSDESLLVQRLLDRGGTLFSDELGIDLERNTPSPLFRWFCAALLMSARISSGIALDAARALTLLFRPCFWRCRAFGLDPLQQFGGGLVFRVLRDKLAGEGFFQDGLAQGIGAGEGGVDLGLERVGGFKFFVENADDFGLFGGGTDWDG